MMQMLLPAVLDACCGSRMMWFDRKDPRCLFIDKRQAVHARDYGTPATAGRAPIVVAPDIQADFTAMPFADESFHMVVFDPPHMAESSASGILGHSYGYLPNDWRGMLQMGFSEGFRVLKPHGVLIFKWADIEYPVSEVLTLTPEQPLFGHRNGRSTHWYIFMKSLPPPVIASDCVICNVGNPGVYVQDGRMICPHRPASPQNPNENR